MNYTIYSVWLQTVSKEGGSMPTADWRLQYPNYVMGRLQRRGALH
jgi:hypothetical protein